MQNGSVVRRIRKVHSDIWQFRWREETAEGKKIDRLRQIGTIDQIPDIETARKAASLLVPDLNARTAKSKSLSMTIAQLCGHFEQTELSLANTWRSYSTKTIYKVYLKRWIIPKWSERLLSDIRTIEVEAWLRSLPIARSTCAKIRNVMSVLFNHACRYEFFDGNPIRLVRQSAKRRSPPIVLTPGEIRILLEGLKLRERTLVFIAASTDIRQSELFALKWDDINLSAGTMNVSRSPKARDQGHPQEVGKRHRNRCHQPKIQLTMYQRIGMFHTNQMVSDMTIATARHESKTRFLQAALQVIRTKGYTATTVEDVCEAAGLTKGSFFHHFDSKEELALAAADYWTEGAGALFASAPYHARADALERLLAYVDFRKALLTGKLADFTCLAGTMVQEVYDTHPAIREACNRSISGHAETLEPDIAEAMRKHGVTGEWTARSLALHIQAVLQGSFILAKAKGGPAVAAECVDHLRRYIEMLFQQNGEPGLVGPVSGQLC